MTQTITGHDPQYHNVLIDIAATLAMAVLTGILAGTSRWPAMTVCAMITLMGTATTWYDLRHMTWETTITTTDPDGNTHTTHARTNGNPPTRTT